MSPTNFDDLFKNHTTGTDARTVIAKHIVPDINSDGTLGADDLVRLKKIVLGIDLVETDVDNDIYETIMDLNDDGKYNIMDLIRLKRIMLDL